jgi:hypothetical protein
MDTSAGAAMMRAADNQREVEHLSIDVKPEQVVLTSLLGSNRLKSANPQLMMHHSLLKGALH